MVIDGAGEEIEVKGAEGSVILYPSTTVHRVAEVVTGERLACVGWIKSKIRSAEQRNLVFELDRALADLRASDAPQSVVTRLANIKNNLLRNFGD